MKVFPIIRSIFASTLFLVLGADRLSAEAILQYFNTSWKEIEQRIPELAERGYDSLWLPPPFKGGAGTYSVGFDTFDRFDLGDKDQSGTVRTKYGTKAELLSLVRTAHRFGLRVYFDNVMAHNAGPLDSATLHGHLFPGMPGFVPEDFHIVRDGDKWRKPADWPNWSNEWEVLNRNPFGWDIAQEDPNTSFDPTGTMEGVTYPKWHGIRHPGQTSLYPDLDLTVGTNQAGDPLHPFADCEPYQDVGYTDPVTHQLVGAGNGRFDFKDLNGNGQHDPGEPCEPFDDTGVDPTVPEHHTATWGYGDGRYNMGDPVDEDVNQMLLRAVRWFIHVARPDGFRLDAVKHVPSYFFGKRDGSDKDWVNWGYTGQIQEEFNLSRGFSDWNNHRDTVFNAEYQARDDAMLFGEHLGAPPAEGDYLAAGMRISNDNLLNTVRNSIGSSLVGYDQPNYGSWGTPSQSVSYVMSHDNAWLWGGDRPLAHAFILTRECLPIIYTDGYNQSGPPDYFPKPSGVNFLGQFGDTSVISALAVHRDFARGYQVARWSDQYYAAYERFDDREKKDNGTWNGTTLLFMMARGYQPNGQGRLFTTGFPVGATLVNYSPYGGLFRAYVNGSGQLVDGSGNAPLVPPGGWFAFSWHTPMVPIVWQAPAHQETVAPITIYQNGQPAPTMDHWRTDGVDGDAAYNPYGMPAGDTAMRAYRVRIPRVTDGSNLRFLVRADGSAENVRLKLDGGVNINSQMGLGPLTGDLRDFPPGLNDDRVIALNPNDRVKESSIETYLGYEQAGFVKRVCEKFAARDVARDIIGSPGAETYQAVIGSAGFTGNNGGGFNSSSASAVAWAYHDPQVGNQQSSPVNQFNPAPQNAASQPVDLWVKLGYQFQVSKVWIYYTTDGTTYPEGSAGVGKGTTQVASAAWAADGANDGIGVPLWYRATLPAMPSGTVLRYKVGAIRTESATSVFPFATDDINLAERMETQFEITGFNATTASFRVHNDYSNIATGLDEGFHVLRSRSFVNRGDGASIFRTESQVFYYDTARPTGQIVYPHENDTLGGQNYGAVVLTDSSVTEVWYYIDDLDASNDNPDTGNGLYAWKQATAVAVPTSLGTSGFTKEWRFDYSSIPSSGIANIVVRLKEASSSADMGLSDAAGWFTTLTRHVNTGSSINFHIGYPSYSGELVDQNYVMKVYFKKELIPAGMTDVQFLDEFSIFISSTVSGQPDNPVLQPRAGYTLVRDISATDHMVQFTFPNLYNGLPDFLHTVRAEHQRGSLILSDSQKVKMRENTSLDSDGDGLPDWWENLHQLNPYSPDGNDGANGDPDNDGLTNWIEYLVGLDPRVDDHNSFPRLVPERIAGGVRLSFPTIPGRIYQVQSSETLDGTWAPVGAAVSTVGNSVSGTIEVDDTPGLPARFYRMSISAP